MKKRICSLLLIVIALFVTSACGKKDLSSGTFEDITYKEVDEITNYIKIEMKKGDLILAELYPDIAPITVENFQKLVNEKYYDGIIFHRVVEDFMIQAGDPTGTGMGGSKDTIKGEFDLNNVINDLKHERGVISMARKGPAYGEDETSETMDSASSQFFIVQQTNASSKYLDGKYAAFGKVIAGLDTVDKIAKVKVDTNDKPISDQTIKSIRFIEIDK